MKREDEKVKQKYDKFAKNLAFYYLTMLIGRTTENSIFRKKAISLLGLANDSVVIDGACGTGYKF
jgi:ubiquinone/menaquinone biosynthesis C-methylase UbiE